MVKGSIFPFCYGIDPLMFWENSHVNFDFFYSVDTKLAYEYSEVDISIR